MLGIVVIAIIIQQANDFSLYSDVPFVIRRLNKKWSVVK